MHIELLLILLLSIKHLIIDFPLQTKYQYSNKGKYGHLGGLLHSFNHGIATFLIFSFFSKYAIFLGIMDAIIHYHIDWLKVNININLNWKPDTHEEFWWLLGIDQFLHTLTYIFLIFLVVSL